MSGNKITSVTGKAALTCSSVLGLALGMGAIAPAHAELFITPFTTQNNSDYNNGLPVIFGPSYDSTGFTAQRSSNEVNTYFNLTGNFNNGVSVLPYCEVCNSQPLKVYAPGDQVDSSATFKSSGFYTTTAGNGDYYFGLSDVPQSDPFGWMEITLDNGGVTLDRFAFEDTEGTPAPIPADVPEPVTLSLFAVGGAAVLAARRRKSAKQVA